MNLLVSQRQELSETVSVLLVHSREAFFKLFSFAHISYSFFSSIFSCLQLRLIAKVLELSLAYAHCCFSLNHQPTFDVYVKHGQLRVFISSSVWLSAQTPRLAFNVFCYCLRCANKEKMFCSRL